MKESVEHAALYQEHKDTVDRAMRKQWQFWIGFLGQVVVLAVLVHVLTRIPDRRPTLDAALLRLIQTVYVVIGMAALIASVVLRRFLLRPVSKRRPMGAGAFGIRSNEPDYVVLYRKRWFPPIVLAAAPSMIGFVGYYVGSGVPVFYMFAVPSFLVMFWQRPKKEELLELCAQVQSAGASNENA